MWAGTPYAHLMVPVAAKRRHSVGAGDRELDRFGERRLGLAGGEGGKRVDRTAAVVARALDRFGQRVAAA